ncbi:spore coat protein CotH, partial [Klebsiella pneumoniae]
MGVTVEKEYRVKRSRAPKGNGLKKSVLAGKSVFAHKVNNGGKLYSSRVKERLGKHGRSKEVLIKVTGAAKINAGVRGSIDYISRKDTLSLTDDEGNKITAEEA